MIDIITFLVMVLKQNRNRLLGWETAFTPPRMKSGLALSWYERSRGVARSESSL